jgi:fatty acid desaturase
MALPSYRHYVQVMPHAMNAATLFPDTPSSLRENAAARTAMPDDRAMIRAASELTRDLNVPRASIYWPDMLASAILGYVTMALAMMSTGWAVAGWGLVSVLALYRAGSFIHELTHVRRGSLPGFRLAWNILIGIPLLVPSFLYEGVHSLHHARTRYGTSEDPEYLPLALMKPWTVPLFVAVAALAPVALLVRFGILAPLSLVIPPLRRALVSRASALSINPVFRRRPPEGEFRQMWHLQEAAASVWALALIAGVVTGLIPLRLFAIGMAIAGATIVINQVRTLVAHLWENEGDVMSTTAQYLDSVNVPPPAPLAALWAPVGLRYHALHHLLPGLPYHSLGEAHRRIARSLPAESCYHKASYGGLPGLVARLVASTFRARR